MSLYNLFLCNKKDYDKTVKINNDILEYDKHIHQLKNISTLNEKCEKNFYPSHLLYMFITIISFAFLIQFLIRENKNTYIKALLYIEFFLIILFLLGNISYIINKNKYSLIIILNSGKEYPILINKKEVFDDLKTFLNKKLNNQTKDKLEIDILNKKGTLINEFGIITNYDI